LARPSASGDDFPRVYPQVRPANPSPSQSPRLVGRIHLERVLTERVTLLVFSHLIHVVSSGSRCALTAGRVVIPGSCFWPDERASLGLNSFVRGLGIRFVGCES
jgi:hypothetical protein